MPTKTVNGIVLDGNDAFLSRTTEALTLLTASASFGAVKQHVGKIKQSARSGMRAYDKPPTYEVGDATSTANVFWYASTIAHDTYHSKLYSDAGLRGGKVPDSAWIGAAAEEACNKFQLKVLKELRAKNPDTVDHYVKHLQATIDNKTDYYSGDYKKRDW